MSISTFQEKLFKGGCGMGILLGCALVMLGGMFYLSCTANGRSATGQQQGERKVAFTVASVPVYADQLDQAIQSQSQQMAAAGPPGPEILVDTTRQVLDQVIDGAAKAALLAKNGINPDEATLTKAQEDEIDQRIMMAKLQLQFQKKVPANATDADYDKAFISITGKPLAQYRADAVKQIKDVLADPAGRQAVTMSVAPKLLEDHVAATLHPSDDEVKASFDTITAKRVLINGPDADKKIQDAQAQITKGTPFEQVVEKFSTEHPVGGKKPKDSTITLSRSQLANDPNLKPLEGVKAGQVSPVVSLPEGKAIYKFISIQNSLKDFDKKKDQYRKEYAANQARQVVQKQIDDFKKTPGLVTFNSPGYKAFYDYTQAISAAPKTGTPQEKVQAAYEEAKKAEDKNEGYDARVAVLAAYAANNYLWGSPSTDKDKLRPERIQVLQKMLESTESFELRRSLFEAFYDSKQYDEAADQLLRAAQNNTDYESPGFQIWSEVRDLSTKLQKEKHISDAVLKQIQKAQLDWSSQRADYEKVKKEQQEQAAKDKAEAEKAAKAEAPPKGPVPSGPVTPKGQPGGNATKKPGTGSSAPPISPAPGTTGGTGAGPKSKAGPTTGGAKK